RCVALAIAESTSYRMSRVVSARQHHAVNQFLERERFSGTEAHNGCIGWLVIVCCGGDSCVEGGELQGFHGRKDLGETGNRHLIVRTLLCEQRAGIGVHGDEPGGTDFRWCRLLSVSMRKLASEQQAT